MIFALYEKLGFSYLGRRGMFSPQARFFFHAKQTSDYFLWTSKIVWPLPKFYHNFSLKTAGSCYYLLASFRSINFLYIICRQKSPPLKVICSFPYVFPCCLRTYWMPSREMHQKCTWRGYVHIRTVIMLGRHLEWPLD